MKWNTVNSYQWSQICRSAISMQINQKEQECYIAMCHTGLVYTSTDTWFHHPKTICSQWKRSKRHTVQQKIIWWCFKLDYQNLKNRQQHACPTTNLQSRQHSRNTIMLLMFLSLAYIFSSNRLMLLHDVSPKNIKIL